MESEVKKHFYNFLSIFLAAVFTFYLSSFTNAVLAASFFGIVFAVLFKKYAKVAYCGCFIGMSSYLILESIYFIFLASMLATILLHLFKGKLEYGGKLGLIAFLSVLIIELPDIYRAEYNIVATDIEMNLLLSILVIFVAIVSLELTWILRNILKLGFPESESVLASAFTGLIFGLCAFLVPEIKSMGEVAYAASFAGMSKPKLIRRYMLLIALLTGALYFITVPIFRGFGGKLGAIAFLSVIISVMFAYLWDYKKFKISKK
ncbi:MAG: hypothetical protein OH319_03245 [Candidatus Parvarchaeota archaeon]|nr:hypothetical protein [Candidatus Jingweiarchaeum tengchongense]MCW1298511.1 hypothetical protein [Candidatus Jingweiarchaeum tengchongense]MCW1300243.1 hypothetical protein [Candidatus Jingweiarchaeum tengchongense]MCW1304523.1 hypothetical protein [Candidatus Jingweiarchaeum tengchongense]MCW1305749.1 hypothetical protein [Candidatus Jingweiarchaeum tengchongense]